MKVFERAHTLRLLKFVGATLSDLPLLIVDGPSAT